MSDPRPVHQFLIAIHIILSPARDNADAAHREHNRNDPVVGSSDLEESLTLFPSSQITITSVAVLARGR